MYSHNYHPKPAYQRQPYGDFVMHGGEAPQTREVERAPSPEPVQVAETQDQSERLMAVNITHINEYVQRMRVERQRHHMAAEEVEQYDLAA